MPRSWNSSWNLWRFWQILFRNNNNNNNNNLSKKKNNNNNNSVLTPIWDELKVIFLLQNVICMVRYVILPYFVQFSFTGVTIALPVFFFFWQHKAIPFLVSYSITVSRVLKFIDDFSHIFVVLNFLLKYFSLLYFHYPRLFSTIVFKDFAVYI